MGNSIRIGTRSSELALWQAKTVADQLAFLGHKTELVPIDSVGDVVLDKPLYELGITGVFTKNLDLALLEGKIDIAVHSLKDVPTQLPEGIVQAAVLKRGNFNDVLVLKKDLHFFENETATIATGSLRRKAQWLYRYPNHKITGLRGNVNTRLQKLDAHDWDGAIFASAGLKRLQLLPKNHLNLDWMVPAPAQGAVMVAALGKNQELLTICQELNHEETATCVSIERTFLRVLEGGCTAPIGALATIRNDELKFRGVLSSPDGKQQMEYSKTSPIDQLEGLGERAANYLLDKGAKKLMRPQGNLEKDLHVYATKTLSFDQSKRLDVNIGVGMSDFITVRHNRLKNSVVCKPVPQVVITSQNAVHALLSNVDPSELNFGDIYCVGRRTKRLIEKRIGKVTHSEQSAEKLADYLVENLTDKKIAFFCGNKRREVLPEVLKSREFQLEEIVCYQTTLSPKKIADTHRGILFFSPSGVESYLQISNTTDPVAFCIGETTAKQARKYFSQTIVASIPTVEGVIDAVNSHFQS
ncbi:MAG: hydroxymethylbilane synthase [Lutibacter sp.]|jgi:hydroxymethylbilane synthase|nr:hydroxymethylbilane synthase [Lutibacter sp.]